MTSFDDELRATMRHHDDEAPRASSLLAFDAPPRRHRWVSVATAAAAVVAVAGVLFAFSRNPDHEAEAARSQSPIEQSASAAMSCPSQFQGGQGTHPLRVPAPPRGIDSSTRLVPDRTPGSVVVCSYAASARNSPLRRSRPLSGDLSNVTDTLTWMPRQLTSDGFCAMYLGRYDGTYYLLGLTYPAGTVWVAAPGNHCQGAGNGQFATATNLQPWVTYASQHGRWGKTTDRVKESGPCPQTETDTGRLGQEREIVPQGATRVTLCRLGSNTAKSSRLTSSDAALLHSLATALNTGSTRPSTSTCKDVSGADPTSYLLRFGYTNGPDVLVRVMPFCQPSINNSSLQTQNSSRITSLLRNLFH